MKNLRLYSPAKVTTYVYDEEEEMDYDLEQSNVYNDVDYFEVIKEKLKLYTRFYGEGFQQKGLMDYFDYKGEIYDSIREKVQSAFVDVTVMHDKNRNGKLFGVCDLKVDGELTKEELKIFCNYLEAQYSDGIGEGFEQQDFKVDIRSDEREIQMHFWNEREFFILTEEEIKSQGYTDLYPLEQEETVEIDYSNDNAFDMTM